MWLTTEEVGGVVEVVEVWAHEPGRPTPNGAPWWCGSGHAVGGRLVLTAAHVVCPDDHPLATVQIRALGEEQLLDARVVWHRRVEASDVALVEVTAPGWVPPRRWVRFGRRHCQRPGRRGHPTTRYT